MEITFNALRFIVSVVVVTFFVYVAVVSKKGDGVFRVRDFANLTMKVGSAGIALFLLQYSIFHVYRWLYNRIVGDDFDTHQSFLFEQLKELVVEHLGAILFGPLPTYAYAGAAIAVVGIVIRVLLLRRWRVARAVAELVSIIGLAVAFVPYLFLFGAFTMMGIVMNNFWVTLYTGLPVVAFVAPFAYLLRLSWKQFRRPALTETGGEEA